MYLDWNFGAECCCVTPVFLFLSFMQIAQVHRATLRDGQDVVVKVQHEGIKEIILEVSFFFGS